MRYRKYVGAVALACATSLVNGCAHQPWTLTPGQHAEQFHGSIRNEVKGRFLLYLPKDFALRGQQRYPLIIFLHGSGESGSDIQLVKVNGPPKFLESRADFPFIVVSPQADSAVEGFSADALTVLLTQLKQQLPVDADRVYLTGLSMGGFATYYWASRHPELFAAIAPVSSGWRAEEGCMFKNMPIWAFHGAKDDVVKLENDQQIVDAIKACGGDIRLTVYPEVGHNAWEPAYDDPKLYEWLLTHRRARRPPRD